MFKKLFQFLKSNNIEINQFICKNCNLIKIIFYYKENLIEILIELTNIKNILYYTFYENEKIKHKGYYDSFKEYLQYYFNY